MRGVDDEFPSTVVAPGFAVGFGPDHHSFGEPMAISNEALGGDDVPSSRQVDAPRVRETAAVADFGDASFSGCRLDLCDQPTVDDGHHGLGCWRASRHDDHHARSFAEYATARYGLSRVKAVDRIEATPRNACNTTIVEMAAGR